MKKLFGKLLRSPKRISNTIPFEHLYRLDFNSTKKPFTLMMMQNYAEYYYINDKGKKVYVSSVQLKDKG